MISRMFDKRGVLVIEGGFSRVFVCVIGSTLVVGFGLDFIIGLNFMFCLFF